MEIRPPLISLRLVNFSVLSSTVDWRICISLCTYTNIDTLSNHHFTNLDSRGWSFLVEKLILFTLRIWIWTWIRGRRGSGDGEGGGRALFAIQHSAHYYSISSRAFRASRHQTQTGLRSNRQVHSAFRLYNITTPQIRGWIDAGWSDDPGLWFSMPADCTKIYGLFSTSEIIKSKPENSRNEFSCVLPACSIKTAYLFLFLSFLKLKLASSSNSTFQCYLSHCLQPTRLRRRLTIGRSAT